MVKKLLGRGGGGDIVLQLPLILDLLPNPFGFVEQIILERKKTKKEDSKVNSKFWSGGDQKFQNSRFFASECLTKHHMVLHMKPRP